MAFLHGTGCNYIPEAGIKGRVDLQTTTYGLPQPALIFPQPALNAFDQVPDEQLCDELVRYVMDTEQKNAEQKNAVIYTQVIAGFDYTVVPGLDDTVVPRFDFGYTVVPGLVDTAVPRFDFGYTVVPGLVDTVVPRFDFGYTVVPCGDYDDMDPRIEKVVVKRFKKISRKRNIDGLVIDQPLSGGGDAGKAGAGKAGRPKASRKGIPINKICGTRPWTTANPAHMPKPTDYSEGSFLRKGDKEHPKFTAVQKLSYMNGPETDRIRDKSWEEVAMALRLNRWCLTPKDVVYLKKTAEIFTKPGKENVSDNVPADPTHTPLLPYSFVRPELADKIKMYKIRSGNGNDVCDRQRTDIMAGSGYFYALRHTYNEDFVPLSKKGHPCKNVLRPIGYYHREIDEYGREKGFFAYYHSQLQAISLVALTKPIQEREEYVNRYGYYLEKESVLFTQPQLKASDFLYNTQPKNSSKDRPSTQRTQIFFFADESNYRELGVDTGTCIVRYTV
jgi:hypothetical protein